MIRPRSWLGGLILGMCLWLGVGADAAEAAARWGWLGVRIRDLSEQEMDDISRRHGLREGFGVLIVDVMKETPAENAGMKAGDIVVALRDRPVVDTRTLQRLIAAAGVGERVRLTVLREREGRRGMDVQLAPMPDPVAAERVAMELGFVFREPEAQGELGGRRPSALPAVAAVLRRSRAEQAGLKVGDVLVEVNGRPVLTLEAVRAALLDVALDQQVPLVVRRDDSQVSVVVPAVPALQ